MNTEFIHALGGGMMIGCAAVILLWANGTVLGISGIASRLLPPFAKDWPWRASFMLGLVCSPLLAFAIKGEFPAVIIHNDKILLAIAGVLVGIGTVIGNGCTSGHGVCGLSRLSKRSLVATIVFMLTAIATVTLTDWVTG